MKYYGFKFKAVRKYGIPATQMVFEADDELEAWHKAYNYAYSRGYGENGFDRYENLDNED